MMIHRI